MALDLILYEKWHLLLFTYNFPYLKHSVRKELKTDRLKLMLKVMVLQVQKSF